VAHIGKPRQALGVHQACGGRHLEGQLSATAGGLTRFLNIQSQRFATLTCTRCRYTEIYKTDASTLSNVLDFFGN